MTEAELFDPKGLIHDAFAIEGIGAPECRSVFLDWALGVPPSKKPQDEVRKLLAHYSPQQPADHPMIVTLQAALKEVKPPQRRGGRQGRMSQ